MVKVTLNSDYKEVKKVGKGKFLLHLQPKEKNGLIVADELLLSVTSRNAIINALINLYYPTDKMDAIRNNYDLVRDSTAGDKTEEYTKEYLDMQAWRKKAKELADEIMNEYNKEK